MSEEKNLQIETEKHELDQANAEYTRSCPLFAPRVNIYENDDAIFLVCDLPGVAEDKVDIVLEKNVLTINGYVDDKTPEGYSPAYTEYRIGDFHRKFTVSHEIDQEKIGATMQNGVLHLTMPKVTPSTKKISVQPA